MNILVFLLELMYRKIMKIPKIITFQEALEAAKASPTCYGKKRLLLGNGFSMACYGEFGYKTLYQCVREMGIPKRVENIFKKYGETDFEAVLKMLDDGAWLAHNYKLYKDIEKSEMKKDYETLKSSLTEAIAEVHPEHRAKVSDQKYNNCYKFISIFDDLYTVNYDLLLYWTSLQKQPFKFGDLFSKDEDTDGNDCEYMPHNYSGNSHLYFLHGALHLYFDGTNVRKRVWKDTGKPLVSQIKTALEKKEYPLVVAEGDSNSKMGQIQSHGYLSNCFRKFCGIRGHLFTFGFSMSKQDQHIVDAIIKNESIRHIWIGIRGDFSKSSNKRFLNLKEKMKDQRDLHIGDRKMSAKKGDLSVHFYDADSAKVWR